MTTIRKIVTSKVDGNSADTNDTNEIRPFGEIAVYINTEPNPDKLTLMMFDGIRTHLKSMVLAPGRLYGSDADSGDGNNRDTIKLIPDASLSDYTGNDQYLIIDPTGGNIHIRAGGTIDNSDADLYLGGKQTFVRVSDDSDNVAIRTGLNASIENVVVDIVDELVLPGGPGGVWRMFFLDADYPALGTTVQVGDTVTTSWGTPITAAITNIVQDIGVGTWALHFDQDITAEFNFGDTVTFNRGPEVLLITTRLSKTWTFDSTGKTVLPSTAIFNGTDGIVVDNLNAGIAGLFNDGDVYITGGNSVRFTGIDTIDGISESVLRFWNAEGRHSSGNDPTELVTLDVGNDATNGAPTEGFLKIITEKEVGGQKEWKFDANGVLHLPTSGDIVDSDGNSVLGGGTDPNIWIQTFASQDGFPSDVVSLATSVEYDNAGNVIALFAHQTGIGEFNVPSGSYFSVAKFTAAGQKLWQVRLAADMGTGVYTDGWGLAVDNVDSRIYVAGRVDDEVGYSKSSLIKLNSEDGSLIWSNVYNFGAASDSPVVDVDSEGNPIVVGYYSTEVDTNDGVTVTKIDRLDGTVIWSRLLDGQNDDEAYGMAVGPNNEVVAIGYTAQIGIIDTVETVVAEPVSNVNWTNERPVFNNGFSCTVSFPNGDGVPSFSNIEDTIGNRSIGDTLATIPGSNLGDNGVDGVDDMIVKVATVTAGDTDDRMLVVKYDSTGAIQWQKAIQFDAGYACRGADADIDSQGNVYVCGNYDYDAGDDTNSAMNLVKFNSSGVKQWSRRVVGDCEDFATSIVVGPDDTLYLNGITSQLVNDTPRFVWVVAKYTTSGTVVWQRLIENTTGWSFSGGGFFNAGGGSNLAVRQGYVALSGGFGEPFNGTSNATVVQIDTDGTVFNVGDWEFKAASFSGTLNSTASDITVVNAEKVDSAITGITVDDTLFGTDTTNFLIPTLYTAPGGDNSLVNGAYTVALGNTGTVTLPAGGTITEGYVTSNPTIQLTPASPDVASQKLVIKGGAIYNFTDNGININYSNNTALVGDTLTFYISSNTYADQTLYWWIYPEGANISDPGSGTVVLSGSSGSFSFDLDSDDNEFTVRVSPEDNNYDPASLGVETGLINADAPTFDSEHHLHLTTGDLAETSIILGTDDHNVRTTVNGGIEINTYLYPSGGGSGKWTFSENGDLTFPDATVQTTALVQGEQVFTLDTGAVDYAPTVVDFNLLFVTPAIGYSETDPTSVTLPAGVPGQRLVIFNGYNLATLTVNPGPVGRDISSGVVAEFIYSGFDGLWMPLYGTNSPT
jgi:hypothetical protein